mmetsp:Transcript_160395/g.307838  ORF Transcript_160395/g.307838 Transcript_160395/m.307838 type:complete len:509 (+) Transcript_160395:17-1543(+)
MVASGFSKVSGTLLEDEEDGRQATFQKARAAYDAAQIAYNQQGNSADVLRRFEEAEEVLEPLMQCGGLIGLREKELESLLKGRLHRAVIMAHMEELPDRWAKVKSMADDVLQYDFNNCHARWLRGLSLLNGSRQRREAQEEMKRAVECARALGKDSEVKTWEAEIKAAFEGEDVVEASASGAAASQDTGGEVSSATASSSTPAASDSKPEKPRGKTSGQTIQKGFFNRRSQKAAAPDVAAAKSESTPAPEPAADSVAVGGSSGSAASSATVSGGRDATKNAQRELQLEEQTRELAELRQQLAEMREKQQATRQRQQGWQQDLQVQLETMVVELGQELRDSAQQLSTSSTRGAMDDLKAAVSDLKERMQSDRSWAETGHQKFLDCATEVLTLREMTSREFKERQDMSRQQVAEVKDLAKRLEDVKPSLKVLKERVKIKASAEEEPDLPRMAEQSMRFKALPASVKLQALLDDATMLRLMAFASGLGMLLMLGVFIEAFGYFKCRVVCTR